MLWCKSTYCRLTCKNMQGRRGERGVNPPSGLRQPLLSHWQSCSRTEIGATRPQLHWGQCSARLCWNYRLGLSPQRTDLTMTLNAGPPPPQRRTNFITTFFQLCLKEEEEEEEKRRVDSKSHIQSGSTGSFALTSYLISDIMGKPDLCEQDSLKIHGKEEHSTWEGAPRAPRLSFDKDYANLDNTTLFRL